MLNSLLNHESVPAADISRPAAALAALATGSLVGLALVCAAVLPLSVHAKDKLPYGEGLTVNIPLPESEVVPIVEDIVQNGVIRGTKEYNKDEYVSGAKQVSTPRVFAPWDQGGKVFYKVREEALDPRNFKDSGDVGTLVVRYVVQPQGGKNTVLRIDALFQEDFRRTIHQSNGSVETAEYKDIQEHIEAIQVMKEQNVEAEKERRELLAKKQAQALQAEARAAVPIQPAADDASQQEENRVTVAPPPETAQTPIAAQPQQAAPPAQNVPGQTLEQHLQDLRRQVERLVKAPGAPLKSAPFHTASTMQTLTPGTEVLILISTPYWYGVETHEGQHGWMMRDQLEQR